MNNANLSAATTILKYQRSREEKNVKFDTITSLDCTACGMTWYALYAMITVALHLCTWWAVVELCATKMNGMHGNYEKKNMKKTKHIYQRERRKKRTHTHTHTEENMQWVTWRVTREGNVFGEFLLFIVYTHVRSARATQKCAFLSFVRKKKKRFRSFCISINGDSAVNDDAVERYKYFNFQLKHMEPE